jgi:hypothetical protein
MAYEEMPMQKSAVAGRALRRHEGPRPAELPDVVEGQITEICRDLAVQAKRMRQLQEQADELRTVIRQWAGGFEADSLRGSTSRGGRR